MLRKGLLWPLALGPLFGLLGGVDCQVYDDSMLPADAPAGGAGVGGAGGRAGGAAGQGAPGGGRAGAPAGAGGGSAGEAAGDGGGEPLAGGAGAAGAGGAGPVLCTLQFPTKLCLEPFGKAVIYGRVKVAGRTDAATQGANISAEFGFGPAGSDPRTSPDWLYRAAGFNAGHDPAANDTDEYQYEATAGVEAGSSFSYVYRFTVDEELFYCDSDGAGGPAGLIFDPALLGALTVADVCPP